MLQKGLLYSDYAPFLLPSQPIEHRYSLSFNATIVRFLASLSPTEKWSAHPGARVFDSPRFDPLAQRVMEMQLDVETIRRRYPLRTVEEPAGFWRGRNRVKWIGMLEVVEWVWGEVPDRALNVAYVVQELPLPLVALRRFLLSHCIW